MSDPNKTFVTKLLELESAGGILLIMAAAIAIALANSPLDEYYSLLIDTPVFVQFGNFSIAKPLLLWINDGLMAVFFLFIGLELKREIIEGELSEARQIVLPAVAALGGMIVPASIYILFNHGNAIAMQGWAIPAATDIAFALGVLSILGPRVPTSLKVFLTSIAIFDDLGAILIIAFFYTANISAWALAVAATAIAFLFVANRRGVTEKSVYLAIGAVMWVALLKSGVHATLTGVVLAMFIPMRDPGNPSLSPLKSLEHDLHAAVAFLILPIFAFANSGIRIIGMDIDQLTHGVPLGIALGLFAGKQIGIFGFSWMAVKLKIAEIPPELNWASLYGVAALCGIGFTMSLFIGSLAFEETAVNLLADERLGIIMGSIASGLLGLLVLHVTLTRNPES